MDRKLLSATAFFLVCLSVITAIPPALAQTGQIHINWNETTETFSGNFTWDSTSWEFGPYPKLEIKYLNDTPVSSAIQHGIWLKFVLSVPKNVLEGADFGGAEVGFGTYSSSQQANVNLRYCADYGWDIWSEVFNLTGGGAKGGTSMPPHPPECGEPIFDFWEAQSQFTEDINYYTIAFVGRLNDLAPYGTYNTWTGVFDSEGNYFTPGFSYYSNQSPYMEFVLGSPSGFLFNLTNLAGVPLQALSRGDEFQIRVNSTAINIGLVQIVINTQNFVQIDECWWEPLKLFFVYERGIGVNISEGVEFWYHNETTGVSEYTRILNETLTLYTPTGNTTGDDFVIFQGYFTNDLQSGILDLWMDVFDTFGCWIPPVNYRELLILIDSSLNLIEITDPASNDFVSHVNYSQWFNVSIRLYGNDSLLDNISNVRFLLSGYEYDQMTGDSMDVYLEMIYNLSVSSVTTNEGTISYWYNNGSYFMNPISSPFSIGGVYHTRLDDHILVLLNISFTTAAPEFIYCCIHTEGLDNNSMPASLMSQTRSTPWQLALGDVNPDFWWEKFAITEEGALDLDGDLATTDDQFFVKRMYQSNDTFSTTFQYMWVDIMWDPTAGIEGDEIFSHIDMGLIQDSYEFNWSETFIWLHASNMSVVSNAAFQTINNTIWGEFGYESINWMTKNATWEDMLGKWWWMDDNTWEYQWFFFSVHEGYMVSATESEGNIQVNIAEFGAEFAGLLLFNDTNSNGIPDGGYANGLVDVGESTHFFVIDDVGDLSFMRPFDSNEASGSRTLGIGETVDFGVSLQDVNGTLYPLGVSDRIFSAWDFYTSGEINIEDEDFDRTVESAAIDEMSFMAHFSATEYPGTNKTEASIKVDQYIGDWDLTHFPNDVLEDRSLAISYYAHVSQISFQFAADDVFVETNENSTTADEFSFTSNGTEFAKIRMGGSTYVWGKDDGTYVTNSSTTPFGTFEAMYEGHKDSVSSFNVTSQMYFMTIGFTNWDGYSVDNDPEFVVFPETFQAAVGDSALFIGLGAGAVVVLVAAILVIKRRRI
ncbi:MAG: hypothetical protein ACFE7S_06270 [Candidatus Hodarchaeota archaeon]